jgi:hypothetical protein
MATSTDLRWWRAEPEDMHRAIKAKLLSIRSRSKPRREMYRAFMEAYGTLEMETMGLQAAGNTDGHYLAPTLPRNVVRGGVETVIARIGRDHPLPQVYTASGSYSDQKRAQRMSQALEGGFQNLKVHLETKRSLRDASIVGTGVLKVWEDGESAHVERVFPWELDVDRHDAREGKPRSIYQTKWYDREVLTELCEGWVGEKEFKKRGLADAIEKAGVFDADMASMGADEDKERRIQVVEAWRLPSGKKTEDGRHAIVIDGATLFEEEYDAPRFPFAFMRYKDPIAGLWGDALAAELYGWQVEINMMSERVRVAHYMTMTGTWLVYEGSDVLDVDITNDIGTIIRTKKGLEPQHINPDAVSNQTYQYMESLTPGALADAGISQLSAQSQKPGGDWSGKALDALDDAETGRFATVSQNWENFHIEIGELLLSAYARLAEENKGLTIKLFKARRSKALKWTDFALDPDDITVQVFSTNMLAKTPQSRLKQVMDLFNAKVIDRDLFLRLSGNPDLESETDLTSSMKELADEQIEWMLDADDPSLPEAYQAPTPFQDLTYALHRAQCHWCFGVMKNVPPDNLELLQQYMEDCKALLDAQNAPAPGAAPAGAAAPGPPGAPSGPGMGPSGPTMPGAGPPSPTAMAGAA